MDRHVLKLTRCDRCGAEAKVDYLANGDDSSPARELKFCQHHADQHHEQLGIQGYTPVTELVSA